MGGGLVGFCGARFVSYMMLPRYVMLCTAVRTVHTTVGETNNSHSTVKMASFLRARQAGVQKDLSESIAPGLFGPAEQTRHGINSQIRSVVN